MFNTFRLARCKKKSKPPAASQSCCEAASGWCYRRKCFGSRDAAKPRGLAGGIDLANLRTPALLARLLVIFVSSQLGFHPAPLDQLLEPPEGGPNRLAIVNPHAQTHSCSFRLLTGKPKIIRPGDPSPVQKSRFLPCFASFRMASAPAESSELRVIAEPAVYVLGRQIIDDAELDRFLGDHGVTWETD